jgi:hypothetical protein
MATTNSSLSVGQRDPRTGDGNGSNPPQGRCVSTAGRPFRRPLPQQPFPGGPPHPACRTAVQSPANGAAQTGRGGTPPRPREGVLHRRSSRQVRRGGIWRPFRLPGIIHLPGGRLKSGSLREPPAVCGRTECLVSRCSPSQQRISSSVNWPTTRSRAPTLLHRGPPARRGQQRLGPEAAKTPPAAACRPSACPGAADPPRRCHRRWRTPPVPPAALPASPWPGGSRAPGRSAFHPPRLSPPPGDLPRPRAPPGSCPSAWPRTRHRR